MHLHRLHTESRSRSPESKEREREEEETIQHAINIIYALISFAPGRKNLLRHFKPFCRVKISGSNEKRFASASNRARQFNFALGEFNETISTLPATLVFYVRFSSSKADLERKVFLFSLFFPRSLVRLIL
jgi:hypothetical protein